MKTTLCLLLLTLMSSCGKNAFLESKNSNVVIAPGVGGDGDGGSEDDGGVRDPQSCSLKQVLIKSKNRALNKDDHPFDFWPMRQAEYNRYVRDGKNRLHMVDFGMIILDFDFAELNTKDHKIKNVHLNFSSDQYFQIDGSYEHASQICHNQNYLCSGVEKSMNGHVINEHYRWIDEDFSHYIDGIEPTQRYRKWALREVREGYDVTRMFLDGSTNFSTDELKTNYTIFVTDNHKVTGATLQVSYCE